ncbi:hypothetical protein IK110_04145 [Candidatus Saccharibacteria bacterium]|nr:hypothetical protein [Candidatus Saccharibacteria bacterium]
MRKYRGTIIFTTVVLLITAIITFGIWAFLSPAWVRKSSSEAQMLKEYLVTQLPELEGASANEIDISAEGLYQVRYNGQVFIVNDVSAQNQFGLYLKRNGSCNYEGHIATYLWILTGAIWFACASTVIWPIDRIVKELREDFKKKKAPVSAKATA